MSDELQKLGRDGRFRIGSVLLPDPVFMKISAEEKLVFVVVTEDEARGRNNCRPGQRNYLKMISRREEKLDPPKYYECNDASAYLIKEQPVIYRKKPTALHLR